MSRWVVILLLWVWAGHLYPQEAKRSARVISKLKTRHKNFIQRADSVLTEFQKHLSPVDSNYIVRPPGTWTLKVKNNVSGTRIKTKGYNSQEYFTSDVETDTRHTASFSATYKGVTLGLAVNPARLTGKNHDFEFNVNSYGNKYGLNYSYQTASTFHGSVKAPGGEIKISNGMVKFLAVTTTAYYVFNGKKFSLPAAFTQSYIQKRSAGSFFLGASYHGSSLMINNPSPNPEDLQRIRTNHAGISVGYGYNLATRHNWVMHMSLQPTMVLFSYNRLYYFDSSKERSNDWSDILVTARVAVIHYFNSKYFCGMTYNYNHSKTGDSDRMSVSNGKWLGRFIIGMRL